MDDAKSPEEQPNEKPVKRKAKAAKKLKTVRSKRRHKAAKKLKPVKRPAKKVKAAKTKSKKRVVERSERLDLRLTKKEKAKIAAKAAKLRRTITSVVLEAIEKVK